MFERLAELVSEFGGRLTPVFVVNEYERAIRLWFGKYTKTLQPGLHWKVPLAHDIHQAETTVNTLSLPTQSLVTADQVPVTVAAVITYRVKNVRQYLLKMADQEDSLSDIGMGVVKQAVREHGWAHLSDMDDVLKSRLRKEAGRYGFDIMEFKLVQISRAKVIRLMQE